MTKPKEKIREELTAEMEGGQSEKHPLMIHWITGGCFCSAVICSGVRVVTHHKNSLLHL